MMCIQHIRAVFDMRGISPPGAKLVAICIAEHVDERGITWASQSLMAAETEMSDRMFRKHVRALCEMGLITKLKHRRLQINRNWNSASLRDEAGTRVPTPRNQGSKKSEPGFLPKEPSEPSKNRHKAPKRATRLPDDWQPTEADREYAGQRGFSDSATTDIASNFAEYWQNRTGKNATKLDWSRAWQTWVRNQAKWDGERSRKPQANGGDDLIDRMYAEYKNGGMDGRV